MPTFETALARVNALTVEGLSLTEQQIEAINAAQSVVDVFNALEVPMPVGFAEHVEHFPRSIRVALLAVARDGLLNEMPMTLAWQAAYDCGVDIRESFATERSQGRLTIVVTGPYPADLAARVGGSLA